MDGGRVGIRPDAASRQPEREPAIAADVFIMRTSRILSMPSCRRRLSRRAWRMSVEKDRFPPNRALRLHGSSFGGSAAGKLVQKPGSSKIQKPKQTRLSFTPNGFHNTAQGRPRSGRTLGRWTPLVQEYPDGVTERRIAGKCVVWRLLQPFQATL
jgi:hypothetical protein